MKNIILAAALFCSNLSVHAGTYEDRMKVRSDCEYNGDLAMSGFAERGKSSPSELDALSDKLNSLKGGTEGEKKLRYQAIIYGYAYAKDLKDAYRVSWARCMDYYDFSKPL